MGIMEQVIFHISAIQPSMATDSEQGRRESPKFMPSFSSRSVLSPDAASSGLHGITCLLKGRQRYDPCLLLLTLNDNHAHYVAYR